MTVSSTTSRSDYSGDGITTTFPYTFIIFDASDLQVYVANVLKTYVTDFTVSNVGSASGGNVTFVTAPTSGAAVAIVRQVPATQGTAIPYASPFPEKAVETALDRLTVLDQQGTEQLSRALVFKVSSTFANRPVDDPVASLYLRTKADLSGFEWVALTATGTYVNPITTLGDLLRGGTGGVAERLAMGNQGDVLIVDPTIGKPAWRPPSTVVLTNRTASQHVIGDVVAVDTTNDTAVAADDNLAGSLSVFVVCLTANSVGAVGVYARAGRVETVKATGVVERAQYVRKSLVARAIERTGVAAGPQTVPPLGAIGVALTTAAGGFVTLMLLDQTWPLPTMTARGDLVVGTSANQLGLLPAPTSNGQVLVADATVTNITGLRWGGFSLSTLRVGSASGDYVIANNAAAYVDVDPVNLLTSITLPIGATVFVTCCFTITTATTANGDVALLVDGAQTGTIWAHVNNAALSTNGRTLTRMALVTGLSAGAHTFSLGARTQDAANIVIGNGTLADSGDHARPFMMIQVAG